MQTNAEEKEKLLAGFAAVTILKDERTCRDFNELAALSDSRSAFAAVACGLQQIREHKKEVEPHYGFESPTVFDAIKRETTVSEAMLAACRKACAMPERSLKSNNTFEAVTAFARGAYARKCNFERLCEEKKLKKQSALKAQAAQLNEALEQTRFEKEELKKRHKARKIELLLKDLFVFFTVINYFFGSAAVFDNQSHLMIVSLSIVCAVVPFLIVITKKYGYNLFATVFLSFFAIYVIFALAALFARNLRLGLAGLIANFIAFVFVILYSPSKGKNRNKKS